MEFLMATHCTLLQVVKKMYRKAINWIRAIEFVLAPIKVGFRELTFETVENAREIDIERATEIQEEISRY